MVYTAYCDSQKWVSFLFSGKRLPVCPHPEPLARYTVTVVWPTEPNFCISFFFSFLKPSTALTYFLYSVTVLLFPLTTDPLHSAGDYQSYDPLSGQRAGSLGLERWVHWMRTSPSEIDQISGISSLTLEERSLLS